jgi:hypothetical protein
VTVDTNSDLYIKDKHFRGTPGLWELLTRKSVNKKLVSEDDMKRYKSILNLTSAHLKGYEPQAPIHVSRGMKFRSVIAKLFPQTKCCGIEASLRRVGEILAMLHRLLRPFQGLEFRDSAETTKHCT